MSRPRALDLYCGAGGAARGMQRAGFNVVGVDIRKQPRYPFRFVQADALHPPFDLREFDFVWASPVCQHHTNVWRGRPQERERYPDLIEPTRRLLATHPLTVMENVPGAPLRSSLVLTGADFGLPIVRARIFECRGFTVPLPLCAPHRGTVKNGDLACVVGHGAQNGWRKPGEKWSDLPEAVRLRSLARNNRAGWSEAMGIDWMTRAELSQAIPPAYSQFIAHAALRHISWTEEVAA